MNVCGLLSDEKLNCRLFFGPMPFLACSSGRLAVFNAEKVAASSASGSSTRKKRKFIPITNVTTKSILVRLASYDAIKMFSKLLHRLSSQNVREVKEEEPLGIVLSYDASLELINFEFHFDPKLPSEVLHEWLEAFGLEVVVFPKDSATSTSADNCSVDKIPFETIPYRDIIEEWDVYSLVTGKLLIRLANLGLLNMLLAWTRPSSLLSLLIGKKDFLLREKLSDCHCSYVTYHLDGLPNMLIGNVQCFRPNQWFTFVRYRFPP